MPSILYALPKPENPGLYIHYHQMRRIWGKWTKHSISPEIYISATMYQHISISPYNYHDAVPRLLIGACP